MGIVLFGSEILFIILAIIVLIISLIFEYYEKSWGIFISLSIFILIMHYMTNYPIIKLIFNLNNFVYLLIYFFIGILYSLLKTYIVGKQLTKEYEKDKLKDPPNRSYNYDPKKSFELKDHVYRWIIWWWVSLINMIIGELPKKIYNYVYKKLEKLYLYIWNLS